MKTRFKDLIPKLLRPQLLGQHRECCALREVWLGAHAVNYVFDYSPYRLYAYHLCSHEGDDTSG